MTMITLTNEHYNKLEKINKRVNLIFNPDREESYIALSKKRKLPEALANNIKLIYDIACNIFTKDRVDLVIQYKADSHEHINRYGNNVDRNTSVRVFDGYSFNEADLTILFPEIEITDGENTHTIRDLLFILPIVLDEDKLYIDKPDGLRLTRTTIEQSYNYNHSHLGCTGNLGVREDFCIGVGDIGMTQALLNSDINEENIRLHLFQAINYLKWESISGGPYANISPLRDKTILSIPEYNFTPAHDISNHWSYILASRTLLKASWEYRDNSEPVLQDTQEFEDSLKDILYDSYRDSSKDLLFKTALGEYYKENGSSGGSRPHVFNTYTIFKKKKIYHKVILNHGDTISQQRTKENLYLHPKIIKDVRDFLQARAKKAYIRSCALQEYNKSKRFRQRSKPNKVLMF